MDAEKCPTISLFLRLPIPN